MNGRDWSAGENGVSMLERVGFLQQRESCLVSLARSRTCVEGVEEWETGRGEGQLTEEEPTGLNVYQSTCPSLVPM